MINKKVIVLGICFLGVFGGIVAFNFNTKSEQIETLNAFISSESVTVQSGNSGTIKNIQVKQSDKVHKGQVIAEIETSKSVVKQTGLNQKNYTPTEQEYENAAIMYKDGVISQEEYDSYISNLNQAKKKAEQPANKVVYTSQISKVYAPIDGTIILNNLKTGDNIAKETILAKVNSTHKEINAYFPVSDESKVVPGKEVNITVIKYPEKTFSGKINSVLNPETKGIPVKITFDQDTSNLDFQNGDSVIVKIK